MKRYLLSLAIFIATINCYAQITYEKGYFITNSNEKVDCLIKNEDWKNNPSNFSYKLTSSTEEKNKTIDYIKEFGINNVSKFKRFEVNIDRSSNNVNSLSKQRTPIFKKEKIFLKSLINGTGNLYTYRDGNLNRYFYSSQNTQIEQLIHKKYMLPEYIGSEYKIAQNNRYKQQLWKTLKCESISLRDIEKLRYSKNSLINFFIKYNNCKKSDIVNFTKKTNNRDLFNLTLKVGLNNSSLKIGNHLSSNIKDTDFGSQYNLKLGIDAEYILPFNKNKWALFITPTYQSFKSEKTLESNKFVSGGKSTHTTNYKSIETPIGIRHYFFINKDSKIFLGAAYVVDKSFNSTISFKRAGGSIYGEPLEIESQNNLAFSLGYKLNNKFLIEVTYQTNREILSNYSFWATDYSSFSLSLGYTIF